MQIDITTCRDWEEERTILSLRSPLAPRVGEEEDISQPSDVYETKQT